MCLSYYVVVRGYPGCIPGFPKRIHIIRLVTDTAAVSYK